MFRSYAVLPILFVLPVCGVGCAGHQATAMMARAADAHARGELASAARDYRDALTLDPHLRGAMQNLALLAHHASRAEDALAFARREVAQYPEAVSARMNLAILLAHRGATDEVVAALKPLENASRLGAVIIAESTRRAGHHHQARAWLARAVAQGPATEQPQLEANVHRSTAWLYAAEGAWKESLESIARLGAARSESDAILEAFVSFQLKGAVGALTTLDGLVTPAAKFTVAWCLAATQADEEARSTLGQIALPALPSPLRLEAYHLTARLALRGGDHHAALKALEAALAAKTGPELDLELDHVLALALSGDEAQARERLAGFLERSPDHPRGSALSEMLVEP